MAANLLRGAAKLSQQPVGLSNPGAEQHMESQDEYSYENVTVPAD